MAAGRDGATVRRMRAAPIPCCCCRSRHEKSPAGGCGARRGPDRRQEEGQDREQAQGCGSAWRAPPGTARRECRIAGRVRAGSPAEVRRARRCRFAPLLRRASADGPHRPRPGSRTDVRHPASSAPVCAPGPKRTRIVAGAPDRGPRGPRSHRRAGHAARGAPEPSRLAGQPIVGHAGAGRTRIAGPGPARAGAAGPCGSTCSRPIRPLRASRWPTKACPARRSRWRRWRCACTASRRWSGPRPSCRGRSKCRTPAASCWLTWRRRGAARRWSISAPARAARRWRWRRCCADPARSSPATSRLPAWRGCAPGWPARARPTSSPSASTTSTTPSSIAWPAGPTWCWSMPRAAAPAPCAAIPT
jgi:hypothetical protein